MMFESWAGLLAPPEFRRFALRAVARTMQALRSLDVPLIYYANQGACAARARSRRSTWTSSVSTGARGLDGVAPRRSARTRPCRAISIRPRCSLRPQSSSGRCSASSREAGPTGPHLQSRPRHLARHRSRCCRAPGRLRAREPRMNELRAGLPGLRAASCRARICAMLESFEPTARFEAREWQRPQGHRLQGGGEHADDARRSVREGRRQRQSRLGHFRAAARSARFRARPNPTANSSPAAFRWSPIHSIRTCPPCT